LYQLKMASKFECNKCIIIQAGEVNFKRTATVLFGLII